MEKFLLDTHTLLWYLLDDENLSKKAKEIIDVSECYFSKVSLWEIAIKQSLGKLRYKENIISINNYCKEESFLELPITEYDLESLKSLPFIHNDPFDRLLIAQAKNSNATLITRDSFIPQYDIKTLW